MHARLSEAFSQAAEDDNYVAFTQTPICVLDQLDENHLLKIAQLDDDNNTATLFFRGASTAHERAKLWLVVLIEIWRLQGGHEDIEPLGESITEPLSGQQKVPDGAWGPFNVGGTRRTLIIEVCFSQSEENMETKLNFWFDAGVRNALLLDLNKESRQIFRCLCGGQTATNRSIVKEGSAIEISPADIAERNSRDNDVNLRITVDQIAEVAPRIWIKVDDP
ncbi:hypothetical protein KEM56_003883 [Ascosphaera pollenicola]|nr:hypothetical protein KEM56_003883 [Ascosphaera pollenicola]